MANYTATARTNYFTVKNLDAFRAGLHPDIRITTRSGDDPVENDTPIALIATAEGGWPVLRHDETTGEADTYDIIGYVGEHLTEGQIAYGLKAGSEKDRYIYAAGWATNGKTRFTTNLEDEMLYEIEEFFGSRPTSLARDNY